MIKPSPLKRPRVVIHIAQTVDARISLRRGPSKWEEVLATYAPKATPLWGRVLGEEIRPDLLLTGSETLMAGARRSAIRTVEKGPRTTGDFLPDDVTGAVRERVDWKGWHAVVDSKGRIPWETREETFWGKAWHPLVLASNDTPSGYLATLRQKMIPYLVTGSGQVDLGWSMAKLHTKLGINSIASLGGSRLNGALLRAGLFDEVSVVLVPMLAGGEMTPTSFECRDLELNEMPVALRLLSSEVQDDGSVWLRYLRKPT